MRVIPDADVTASLGLPDLLPVVADALRKGAAGAVERPPRPHFPVGDGAGTALVMPAYVHGAAHYATKLASVHEHNDPRPTVQAQVALTDATTGTPVAFMGGRTLTNARTACIGGLAVRTFAPEARRLAVLGAGTQARWQTRAVATVADLDAVTVFSPSDSRDRCAADLDAELDADVTAASSPRDCVAGADAVVTATTATEPVFPGDELSDRTLVVAVGAYAPEMRELDTTTLDRAVAVYADVPEEALETGDLAGVADGRVDEFGHVVDGDVEHDGVVVVKSVGSAVLDAAAAEHVYELAVEDDVGTTLSLDGE
jgi:alanine dehydrogenase